MIFLRIFILTPFFWGAYMLYNNSFDSLNLKFLFSVMAASVAVAFGDAIKNFIVSFLKSWWNNKKEHKAWEKNLARQAKEIEVLGKAQNKVKIDALEAETKALIARIKAGEQVQDQLFSKFNELTAIGDKSYDYLKKEIQNMPSMKNVNFNL